VSLPQSAFARPGGLVLADLLPGERLRDAALVLGYAALTGLAAQLAIKLPFTPVPITGQTFAVLLGAAALGWRRAAAGMALYLAVGLAGLPWFAEARGGLDTLTAPSFGYLFGFLLAAAVVGRLAAVGLDRTPPRTVLTMVVGNLVIYAFGLPWLMATVDVGLREGLRLGVTPFLAGDALKLLLAAGLLPGAWALAGRRDG
jgi:biotin transport system substrate-specific component